MKSHSLIHGLAGPKVIENLRKDIVGEDHVFKSPFGVRKCLYLDQTASGKPVKSIENFIMENVLPVYANTHSTSAYCASQITQFREEAREILKESCQCSEEDVVIFCGSGSTSAVHKLIHAVLPKGEPAPIVILGPYEHHSNILPWRSVAKKIITVSEDIYGSLNLSSLEEILQRLKKEKTFKERTVFGAFSAASNVTGALTDTIAVTILMHRYGGLAVWDYSAAAPHDEIEMNSNTGSEYMDKLAQKDAIFFSGHKFTGGPQTTGVLIAKKYMFRNSVPQAGGGGGTVFFVRRTQHTYTNNLVEREEAGTPNIVGSIRMGLVLQLKDTIGSSVILSRENYFTKKVLRAWETVPEIKILGCITAPRAPIISILIQDSQTNLFLHHDFVVRLLNDMFGIQCRGGCMCAGPYGSDLLGIDEDLANKYEQILSKKTLNSEGKEDYSMIFKPGFVRITLPFYASEEEVNFTIEAVEFVAKFGWQLLPLYKMNVHEGTFRFQGAGHLNEETTNDIRSFNSLAEGNTGDVDGNKESTSQTNHGMLSHKGCLQFAQDLVSSVGVMLSSLPKWDDAKEIRNEFKPFRWFMLSSEARKLIKDPFFIQKLKCPFSPRTKYGEWDTGSFSKSLTALDANELLGQYSKGFTGSSMSMISVGHSNSFKRGISHLLSRVKHVATSGNRKANNHEAFVEE